MAAKSWYDVKVWASFVGDEDIDLWAEAAIDANLADKIIEKISENPEYDTEDFAEDFPKEYDLMMEGILSQISAEMELLHEDEYDEFGTEFPGPMITDFNEIEEADIQAGFYLPKELYEEAKK